MSGDGVYLTLAVRLKAGSSVPKRTYIKAHKAKSDDDTTVTRNAVFVAGLPLQLTEARLHDLVEVFGSVEQVRLYKLFSFHFQASQEQLGMARLV
jgi:hypothetical protein